MLGMFFNAGLYSQELTLMVKFFMQKRSDPLWVKICLGL